jgi:DNA-binding NarL/FixJ family response regulator
MRAGVRRALESGGLRVVAEATSAGDAVAAALRHRPTVCLLAVQMPGSGIVASRQIKTALPATKLVMLSASERDEDLFAAVLAGADGYLLGTTCAARLPNAVLGVVSGEAAIPRRLMARLVQDYRSRGRGRLLRLSGSSRRVKVTARESEVIARLREGESTAEIARALGISQVTVRRHISSLEHKLQARNRRAVLTLLKTAELEVPPEGA